MHDVRQRYCRGNPLWLPFLRAGTAACPYKNNNSMNMVRHDDERIALDVRIMIWQFIPNHLHHPSRIIRAHFSINDMTKQTGSMEGHNSNEIRSGLCIVITLQSDRSAVVFFRGTFHRSRSIDRNLQFLQITVLL